MKTGTDGSRMRKLGNRMGDWVCDKKEKKNKRIYYTTTLQPPIVPQPPILLSNLPKCAPLTFKTAL